jgi:hypothetical protein
MINATLATTAIGEIRDAANNAGILFDGSCSGLTMEIFRFSLRAVGMQVSGTVRGSVVHWQGRVRDEVIIGRGTVAQLMAEVIG